MKFKILIENILLEANKRDVLINKLGIDDATADALVELCGPLAVLMANKLLEEQLRIYSTWNEKKTKEDAIKNLPRLLRHKTTEITGIMDWIRVGLNGNIGEYKNLPYFELELKAHDWHESLGAGSAKIDYIENHPIILDFRVNNIGYYWCDLQENYSEEEKERMGHCARSRGDLFSLRETIRISDKHTMNRSVLTGSIQDGYLLQLKGAKNSKPKSEYHKYIVPLLELQNDSSDSFSIIGFDREYDTDNDFKISDLSKEYVAILYEKRPDLFNGWFEKRVLYNLGIIERPSNDGTFEYIIDAKEVQDYFRGVENYRQNIIWTILSGDTYDLWDNFEYADWKSSLNYYLNKENEQRLIKIAQKLATDNNIDIDGLDLEDTINELDENGCYEITSAIKNATVTAERDSYENYIYNEIKSGLETYGEVLSLNDEGARLMIDINTIVRDSRIDDDTFLNAMHNCEVGNQGREWILSCVFYELLRDNEILMPKFDIDDRYYPDVNRESFNIYLNDYLNEI